MKPQVCKFISEDGIACLSPYHSKMYHNPPKPIKRTAIKKDTLDDAIAKLRKKVVYVPTSLPHTLKKPIKRTAIKLTKDKAWKKEILRKDDSTKPFGYKTPKHRKKRSPRAIAKDKAWDAFSMYIRVRDSLATTGTTDYCVCITCNERGDSEPKEFRHIQAGHAVGGRGNAVLFHEEITNGQCDFCNRQGKFGLSGDYGNYAIALVKRYGIEHAEELQRLKGTTKVYKTHDFIEIEALYKQKLVDLLHR